MSSGPDHYIAAEDAIAVIEAIFTKVAAEGRFTSVEEDVVLMRFHRTLDAHLKLAEIAAGVSESVEWQDAMEHHPQIAAEALSPPKNKMMATIQAVQEEEL